MSGPRTRPLRRRPGPGGRPAGSPADASTSTRPAVAPTLGDTVPAPARPKGSVGAPVSIEGAFTPITGAKGEPVIETRGLSKHYPNVIAVDSLDLTIRRGEVFGLLGPNGAGKTTTVLMLLGLSEPTGGAARVVGLDPTRAPLEVKRVVGYMPDNVGFYGDLTGRENLRYTARLNGFGRKEAEERISHLLDQVGLVWAADRRADTYSRGMRQRLGIADALFKDPEILILDEPTIAIDPAGVSEILGLIRRLVDEQGLTVLLSSHLLEQVETVCDRVAFFVDGRMIAIGTVAELAAGAADTQTTIEIGLRHPPDDVAGRIGTVAGVREVVPDAHHADRLIVTADRDVRAELTRWAVGAGLEVIHLQRRGEELDAIYRRLVIDASGHGVRSEAPTPGGSDAADVAGDDDGN